MQTLVSIDGIDLAIANLACKPDTLKAKLLAVLKEYFPSTQSLKNLTEIPAEELVAKIWQIDNTDEIRQKKKNLSSLKSSLNKSLKKLAKEGLNPEGIVIGRNNVFEVSEEQKNELLQTLGVTSGDIPAFGEMLSALKDALPEMTGKKGAEQLNELFDGLEKSKKIIADLSSRLGDQETQIEKLNSQLQEAKDGTGGDLGGGLGFDKGSSGSSDGAASTAKGKLPDEFGGGGRKKTGDAHVGISENLDGESPLDGEGLKRESSSLKHDKIDERIGSTEKGVDASEQPEGREGPKVGDASGGSADELDWIGHLEAEGSETQEDFLEYDANGARISSTGEEVGNIGQPGGSGAAEAGDALAGLSDNLEGTSHRKEDSGTGTVELEHNESLGEIGGAGLGGASIEQPGGSEVKKAADSLGSISENLDETGPLTERSPFSEDNENGGATPEHDSVNNEGIESIPEEKLKEVEVDEGIEAIPEDELEEVEVDEDIETLPEDELEEVEIDEEIEAIPEDELEEVEIDEDIEAIPEDELEEVEIDEEIEAIPEDELEEVEIDEEIEAIPEDELEEVEIDEEIEAIPEDELEEVEVDEDIEALPEDELEEVEVDEDIEALPEDELEEVEVDEDIEALPEDELEEVEVDEDIEALPEDELEEVEVDEDIEALPEDELEEVEVDEDIEALPEDELEEVEVDEDIEAFPEDELEEAKGDEEIETLPEDELEEVEVDEDIEALPEDELEEVEVDEDIEALPEDEFEEVEIDEDIETIHENELEEIEERTPRRLIEVLSKYMEPEEAFQGESELLSETEEGLVAQLMDRFTPRFIKIPQGEYLIGSQNPKEHEQQLQKISLDAFYIGQYPVTNDIFDLFVRETGYQTDAEKTGFGIVHQGQCVSRTDPKTGRATLTISKGHTSHPVDGANWRHPNGPAVSFENKADHPVVQTSRQDAQAFAAWAGKRLPTEVEWESAARGKDGRLFPWGNIWDNKLCNLASSYIGDTTPVGNFGPTAASPYGLCDLLGNVFEWTSTVHHKITSTKEEKNIYILKGGSWATSGVTSLGHRLLEPDTWSNIIGFRCVV